MPDNPKKAKADDDSEIDSVMADEESPPIGDAAGEPGTSPAPQSIASTGLFVPEASGPEPREREPTRDELIKAQLDFQRQMVAKLKAREAKKEAGRQPSAKAEPDVDIEAFRFAALKKKFFARKAAGKIEVPEEIAFLRAESAEIARQRKLRQDAEFDNPATEVSEDDSSDVFLDQAEAADRPGLSSDDEPKKRRRQPEKVAESGDRPSKRTKKSRKVGGQEYSHADLQEVLDTANKSRKKASEQKSGSKKAAKTGPSMTNTSSLWGNDVFKEAARNADLPDQPTFDKTGRRADAMKQLIASVPTEAVGTTHR